ncbi:MAG: ribonuclease III domain-containing protein [Cyanobacteria bacterium P01_H01_bin.121]
MTAASLLSEAEASQIAPAALAYLGDAVYELHMRLRYLLPPQRLQHYHQAVVEQVRAEAQAQHLQVILSNLTEPELQIVRRGRNATGSVPRRVDADIYRQATSFETLVGYLHLTDPTRLAELFSTLDPQVRSPS